jgi:hypothetical protein
LRIGGEAMTNTTLSQQTLLSRFAEALKTRHDHVSITHSELSAAWPGNPDGKSSLKQLLAVIGEGWSADYRTDHGDYVFSRKGSPED